METKKIYEILIDDIKELDYDDKHSKTFMRFVIGAVTPIIKRTAQSIIESGEIPTINKCIDKLDDDTRLRTEIFVILRAMLCASIVVDDKWDPCIMNKLVKINFDVIGKDLQRLFRDEPDEDEELD